MKAVLISIQPKWCELIAKGEKTVEIRKTRPNMELPFTCHIYRTKGFVKHLINGEWVDMPVGGTIIGEFTCDKITPLFNVCTDSWQHLLGDTHKWHKQLVKKACLSEEALHDYANGKNCFAWHISNLKIYDKPKPLGAYGTKHKCNLSRKCTEQGFLCAGYCKLTRPPQSWCYVEVLKDGK